MIYDVTLPLFPGLAVWPGDPPIVREVLDGHAVISRWTLGSHAGTHVDAPAHFRVGASTVDRLDPATLIGPCRVLDLPETPCVTAEVLAAYDLTGVERLLMSTRNSNHWREDPTRFVEEYVGMDASAARWLVSRGVKLIGIDGLSIGTPAEDDVVHETLLRAGVVIVEGLALAEIPPGAYRLICAPLKLRDGDGAPARVFLER